MPCKLAKTVVSNVQRIRKEKGVTQETLAKRAKLAVPTVNRILKGKYEPTLTTVEKLAKALKEQPLNLLS